MQTYSIGSRRRTSTNALQDGKQTYKSTTTKYDISLAKKTSPQMHSCALLELTKENTITNNK